MGRKKKEEVQNIPKSLDDTLIFANLIDSYSLIKNSSILKCYQDNILYLYQNKNIIAIDCSKMKKKQSRQLYNLISITPKYTLSDMFKGIFYLIKRYFR